MSAWLITLASLLLWSGPLAAHGGSQAYLDLRPDASGQWLRVDVALRDLDAELDLDADGDGQLRWGELRRAAPRIQQLLRAGLNLEGCDAPWRGEDLALERRADGVYAVQVFRLPCPAAAAPRLHYALFAGLDAEHRALLRWTPAAGAPPGLSLLRPTAAPTPRPQTTPLFAEGVHHLLSGYDHLLFLLCLLLPAVLTRAEPARRVWAPRQRWQDSLGPLVGLVTAFTLAHSLTLALAVLGDLRPPPALIEPLIAASIVLAALDNLRPLWPRLPRWIMALGFGLIHGFGFAGVLAEMELARSTLAWSLLQFNLGLELAQLALLVPALGLLWRLRLWPAYPRWVLGAGSGVSALVGAGWLLQRLS